MPAEKQLYINNAITVDIKLSCVLLITTQRVCSKLSNVSDHLAVAAPSTNLLLATTLG